MDDATLLKCVGLAVRKRRVALGYSQDTFADVIGMHRAYFSSIERGERNITLATFLKVTQGLNIKLGELLRTAGL